MHVRMWSPDDSSDPMPLLVVRDGPDYDRLAQLTTRACGGGALRCRLMTTAGLEC